ncbi:hypothetical protein [Paraburkholderia sp. UCT31]|uniref:hypothetical protein n=1 Tax=Paraburkholderia sp. UCT31 TaxID=2615209 RepID=UPI0016564CBE|nr:hypothetical protein [Paraburkholderia sp. UCT31]
MLEKLREAEFANQALLASYALQQLQAELAAQTAADAQLTAQYQAEATDRDSARQLAAKQPKDLVRLSITFALIAGAAALGYAVFGGSAMTLLKDPTSSLTAGTFVGYVFSELKQSLAFWFGTTSEATAQMRTITGFAVSPGTVTSDMDVSPAAPTVNVAATPAVGGADNYRGS